MSKKQDKLARKSETEALWYDSLNAEKKKAYTRASVISCKRVEKREKDYFTISEAIQTLMSKGAVVNNLTIDFTTKSSRRANDAIGLATKGKIAFLVNHRGYTVVGL